MATQSKATFQRVVPYLCYEDAPAAIDFLCAAFGFTEHARYPVEDGRIGHAELRAGACAVMVHSPWEGFGMDSPRNLPASNAMVFCEVDDVEAHFRHARAAGATIVTEPSSGHGSRMYRALDCEGHRWMFSSPDAAP